MKKMKTTLLTAFLLVFLTAGWAAAVSVTMNPTYTQRPFHGSGNSVPIPVHIYLNDAVNLLNFSIKLNYDNTKFEVEGFDVNPTVWNFVQNSYLETDGSGTQAVYLSGAAAPVNGDVELGYVVLKHIGGIPNAPVCSTVTASLARPSSYTPEFVNFVNSSGTNLDSTIDFSNATATLNIVGYYDQDACEGDFNNDGAVNSTDETRFLAAYPSEYPDSNYDPACDLDGDGVIDSTDYDLFYADLNRTIPCPACGGYVITTQTNSEEGVINPAPVQGDIGYVTVGSSGSYTFTVVPNALYSVKDVQVDGVSVLSICTKSGANRIYTFTNVTANHTLAATFCNLPGDVNGDGVVNSIDALLMKRSLGSMVGDANYNPRADLDQNGVINSIDALRLKRVTGTTCQ